MLDFNHRSCGECASSFHTHSQLWPCSLTSGEYCRVLMIGICWLGRESRRMHTEGYLRLHSGWRRCTFAVHSVLVLGVLKVLVLEFGGHGRAAPRARLCQVSWLSHSLDLNEHAPSRFHARSTGSQDRSISATAASTREPSGLSTRRVQAKPQEQAPRTVAPHEAERHGLQKARGPSPLRKARPSARIQPNLVSVYPDSCPRNSENLNRG